MTTTTLCGRDLRELMNADEAQRRYERRMDRGSKRRPQRSKRQRDAWKHEVWS